jgi:hypothetical protein
MSESSDSDSDSESSGPKLSDSDNAAGLTPAIQGSPLPEVPVNEITTPGQQPSSSSINGGRSHYVHSTNKKASTHRHHKRRNRHQTLRNYKK